MGMRKMELTERAYRRGGCCSLQQAGKERGGGNWGRDQMQMEDRESRPSGGRDGAAKQWSWPKVSLWAQLLLALIL